MLIVNISEYGAIYFHCKQHTDFKKRCDCCKLNTIISKNKHIVAYGLPFHTAGFNASCRQVGGYISMRQAPCGNTDIVTRVTGRSGGVALQYHMYCQDYTGCKRHQAIIEDCDFL